jgi:hypothetical protein
MVHHSIAVVFTSFLTNFVEFYKGEVRRIPIPRTRVNKGKKRVGFLRVRTLPHPGLVRVVARTPKYPVEVAIREPPPQGASAGPQENVEDTVRRCVGDGRSHSAQDQLYKLPTDSPQQSYPNPGEDRSARRWEELVVPAQTVDRFGEQRHQRERCYEVRYLVVKRDRLEKVEHEPCGVQRNAEDD